MKYTRFIGGILALSLSGTIQTQSPQYFVTPAVKAGGTLRLALVGQPGQTFATYADLSGGPQVLLGEEFFLGLTPALQLVDRGVFGLGGLRVQSLPVPATGVPIGTVFYLQAVVADSRANNGMFGVSNGESTVFYNSTHVMVEEFTDPVPLGFTGTYDRSRRNRLQGAAPQHRVLTVQPTQGAPLNQPLAGPLNVYGARVQMVYRAADIGATGRREVLTAVRWLPFGKVTQATYKRLTIDVGHTRVVPDYTIDPWTSLPKYPASGLDPVFANNPKPGETPLRIVDQSYTIGPQDVRADGYLGYPAPTRLFTYNGFDSLLLDFRMEATPKLVTGNGQRVHLMVTTLPRPDGRVYVSGSSSVLVDPHKVTQGRGDNALSYMQFGFARIESEAVGPWRKAPVPNPVYLKPTLAKSEPAGTSIQVEYRGALNPTGTQGPWVSDIAFVGRLPYLQIRVTFFANPFTGAVPSLESIVIPVQ